MQLPAEAAAQIEAALARGNKIEAIKLYRHAANCGLKEAKDAIEQMAPANPTASSNSRPKSNSLAFLLALIIIAIALIAFLIASRH